MGEINDMESLIIFVIGVMGHVVPRQDVTKGVIGVLDENDKIHCFGNFNSLKSSIARSITTLCDKGVIVGYYQEWTLYAGTERETKCAGIGAKPFNTKKNVKGAYARPRLQYLSLTEKGFELFTSGVVNKWG